MHAGSLRTFVQKKPQKTQMSLSTLILQTLLSWH